MRTPAPVLQRGTTVLLDTICFDGTKPTYGRSGLATQQALRRSLCELENGEIAELYPSGLAALTGAMLALCQTGDEILMCDTIYGPTRRFAETTLADYGVSVRYFPSDADLTTLELLFTPQTRLVMLESPGSLTLDMLDIPAIAALARRRGAFSIVDNTYGAGVLFKPLDHGADVSIQALTKYVCGHSDVFMGAAVARGEAGELLQRGVRSTGWTVSSDDAYLALRGMRTLHTRLAAHGRAALEVAGWLAQRPEIHQVLCPALPGSPGHALFTRDYSAGNGLITIVLNGPESAAPAFFNELSVIGLGFSWGGFESLAIPCNGQLCNRRFTGKLDRLVVRLHIGLETTADIIAELERALTAFAAAVRSRLSPLPHTRSWQSP